jgi:hypothetical protein
MGLCMGALKKSLIAALSRSCSEPHQRNHIWSPWPSLKYLPATMK